jgi:broad specificity phosphatase PhoE
MMPLFSRDSEGTVASELHAHVAAELDALVAGAGGGADEFESPEPPVIIGSRMPTGKWWTVAEASRNVGARLGVALREVADAADAVCDGSATVLVGHSFAMLRMFRQYSSATFAATSLGRRLHHERVDNCAILRVRLEDQEGAADAPPRIAGAVLLFDSKFRGE